MSAVLKIFQTPLLDGVVDSIGDWDIPDGNIAKKVTIKHPPGTAICLIAQYRVPFHADWNFGTTRRQCTDYQLAATQIHTGVVSIHPQGPFGVIVVCLKPESAIRILGAPPEEFADDKIDLRCVFGSNKVSLLEERLAQATCSAERIAHVEAFLIAHLRCEKPQSAAHGAATYLRQQPALSMSWLASKLDISRRHLSRSFRATFGMSPKRFARIARVEKVLAARFHGSAWADVAYACGFADQAHMIRDFHNLVGQSPDDLFRPGSTEQMLAQNERFEVPYLVFHPVASGTC